MTPERDVPPAVPDGWAASNLPMDPDLDRAEDERHRSTRTADGPFSPGLRPRWPRIHWRTIGAIGAGGFFGGLARYGVGLAWDTRAGAFPWPTFAINTSGAFALALLLVLVLEVLPPTTYLRPALGTGFCGAYTTFSSVALATDQLTAQGLAHVAALYVAASVFAGLSATSSGIVLGRSIAARKSQRGRIRR